VSIRAGDLFCGAGGSSTGLLMAARELGVKVDLRVVNHLGIAIETHKANHPEAVHVLEDIYKVKPTDVFPDGQFVDVLWASPTCTYFSRARGGKPVSFDQTKGRMTPWQVRRWALELRPTYLIVENVPEFRSWGPICKRRTVCAQHGWEGPEEPGEICGRPRKNKAGIYFKRWLRDLELMGYAIRYGVLCAADFGDATTRDRFFLVARCDGGDVNELWPAATHSPDGGATLFGATQKHRAAREIIDWSLEGESIFFREDLLEANTHKRVFAGAIRFTWHPVFAVALRELLEIQGVEREAIADVERRAREKTRRSRAAVVRADNHGGNGLYVRSLEEPAYTPTTNGGLALAQPVVMQANQGADRQRNLRGVDESPLQTVVTGDSLALARPFLAPYYGAKDGAQRTRSVEDPLATQPTANRFGLVEPFVSVLRNHADARSLDEPVPTLCASGNHVGVVRPFVLSQGGGGAPRDVVEPVPTIPTEGAHALLVPYYTNGTPRPVGEPVPTLTTRDRLALVAPVTHADGSCRARPVSVPLPTITGANRGELAFFAAAFGEREGQVPRTHSVDEPAPTIAAKGRVNLIQGEGPRAVDAGPQLDATLPRAARLERLRAFVRWHGIDIKYRMLAYLELAAAMGFPPDYVWPGNKTENTRLIGNAGRGEPGGGARPLRLRGAPPVRGLRHGRRPFRRHGQRIGHRVDARHLQPLARVREDRRGMCVLLRRDAHEALGARRVGRGEAAARRERGLLAAATPVEPRGGGERAAPARLLREPRRRVRGPAGPRRAARAPLGPDRRDARADVAPPHQATRGG
jgi:DNA (cytosine-5)-methyltransferase 1